MRARRLSASIVTAFLLGPGALLGLVAPSGPEIRVATARSEFMPLTAVFPDGGFVVAWTQGGGTPVIHARFYAASGAPTSAELRLVAPAAGLLLDGVAITTDGAFVAAWEQGRPQNRSLLNVFARKFDRRGKPLTPASVVHDPSPYSRYGATVAGTADGGFVVAWAADSIGGTDAIARFFHSNGTAAGPALSLTHAGSSDPFNTDGVVPAAMAVSPDGSVAIVSNCFCDQPAIFLQRFTREGVVTDIDPVPSDCACAGEPEYNPSLSMASDGSFVVAWANGNGLVSSPPDSTPRVIRARRFAADGNGLGSVFQVNQDGRYTTWPLVAVLADGGFVIGWTDLNGRDGSNLGPFARAYDASGATSGPDLRLDNRTIGDQFLTSIAAGAGGRAIAVWQDAGTRVAGRFLTPR